MAKVSVLIPTFNRKPALFVTLTSLYYQTYKDFEVIVADQSDISLENHPVFITLANLYDRANISLSYYRNTVQAGIAQQRQFLLDKSHSPYSLFLDDDVITEPFVIGTLSTVLKKQRCGFAGMGLVGLSYLLDRRPHEQKLAVWKDGVKPEVVHPNSTKWQRYKLHNAANLLHVQETMKVSFRKPVLYKVAWIGGCVMYDTAKLRSVGGFSFWKKLPQNITGEDVAVQVRLLKAYGGCGVLPTGVYHQELPTTLPDRRLNAVHLLDKP